MKFITATKQTDSYYCYIFERLEKDKEIFNTTLRSSQEYDDYYNTRPDTPGNLRYNFHSIGLAEAYRRLAPSHSERAEEFDNPRTPPPPPVLFRHVSGNNSEDDTNEDENNYNEDRQDSQSDDDNEDINQNTGPFRLTLDQNLINHLYTPFARRPPAFNPLDLQPQIRGRPTTWTRALSYLEYSSQFLDEKELDEHEKVKKQNRKLQRQLRQQKFVQKQNQKNRKRLLKNNWTNFPVEVLLIETLVHLIKLMF